MAVFREVGANSPLTYSTLLTEGPEDPEGPDLDQQEKLANLGATIETLKELVPHILRKLLPKSILLPDIVLRVSPTHFELLNLILPTIKGHVSYYTTCKALQLIVTSVILNPRVQLHILSVRTSNFPEPNNVYSNATKVYMRWSTCPEGCVHLSSEGEGAERRSSEIEDENGGRSVENTDTDAQTDGAENGNTPGDAPATARAKLGLHQWSGFDPRLVDTSVASSLADLTKSLIGLKKDDTQLERVVLGVFVFELSPDNSQVLVHTIEDMIVAERRDEQRAEKLRVC